MFKKLALSMGCIVLVSSLSALAHADSITFSFFASSVNNSFTATAAGVNTSTNGRMAISSTGGGGPIFGTGSLTLLKTGAVTPAGSFTQANVTSALGVTFAPGPVNVIDVEVQSPLCISAGNPTGICVTGTENGGGLSAPNGGQGSFQGTFDVNVHSVSPTVLALLGFSPGDTIQVSGSDSLDTTNDNFHNNTKTEDAKFAGGDVTISILPSVPEPGSLLLFGSGLLGMAGMMRRKMLAGRS